MKKIQVFLKKGLTKVLRRDIINIVPLRKQNKKPENAGVVQW